MWNVNVIMSVHWSTLSIISSDSKNRQQPQNISPQSALYGAWECAVQEGNRIHLKPLRERGKVHRSVCVCVCVSCLFKDKPNGVIFFGILITFAINHSMPLCRKWIQCASIPSLVAFLPFCSACVLFETVISLTSYLFTTERKFIVIVVLY